jgi:hypothetical protein
MALPLYPTKSWAHAPLYIQAPMAGFSSYFKQLICLEHE